MEPIVKKLWLAALRSGVYPQGEGRLFRKGKYCCLGILCEISPVESSWWHSLDLPPEVIRKWAGLESVDPIGLSSLNDSGTPFSEIADIIEERL